MGMTGYLKQLTPVQLADLLQEDANIGHIRQEGVVELELGSLWWGLHLILTGDAYSDDTPLSRVIVNGKFPQWAVLLMENDPEYGTPFGIPAYLTTEEVQESAQELSKISLEDFRRKCDLVNLQDRAMYFAVIWDHPGIEDELVALFSAVQAYYLDAARAGNGMMFIVL